MKKTDEKKEALLKAHEERLKSLGVICKELGISRQTAYRWLADAEVKLHRGKGVFRSKIRVFATETGVSLPTARKYIAARERFEKEGAINAEGLREVGISRRKQKEAGLVLHELGLTFQDMVLTYKDQQVKLSVEETIELFKNPIEELRRLLK